MHLCTIEALKNIESHDAGSTFMPYHSADLSTCEGPTVRSVLSLVGLLLRRLSCRMISVEL